MALQSRLLGGDAKLAACLVNDAAHLTIGARGEHVAKVQMALFTLDSLTIDRGELQLWSYGPSTAQAVQSFKVKRQIINHSYQSKPDNIVGKMTIAALDREMQRWEITRSCNGECGGASRGAAVAAPPVAAPPPRAMRVAAHRSVTVGRAAGLSPSIQAEPNKKPQLNRALKIYCSYTGRAAAFDLRPQIQAAKDILWEYGLTLFVEFGGSSGRGDRINFPLTLLEDEDVDHLRKASEDTRPGFASFLRVIICPRPALEAVGQTFRNRTIGNLRFLPFVVINSESAGDDKTLLHEMIHAASSGPRNHDSERHSVFYGTSSASPGAAARTWLKTEHAVLLSESFFAK